MHKRWRQYPDQMRNLGLILIVLIIVSCQSENVDFDPFDNEFRFHRNFKISDYDTLNGECGYWNLTKRNDVVKNYYQFYVDEKSIVAKGFSLDIDEIPIVEDSLNTDGYVIKLLEKHPIDFEQLKQRLTIYKIEEIKVLSPTDTYVKIELVDLNGSTYKADIIAVFEDNKFTRHLTYFNPRVTDN